MIRPDANPGARSGATRPCPLCGGRSPRPATAAVLARACVDCGLVYIDPVPPEAIDPATYGNDYYEPWQGREEGPRRIMWKRRLGLLAGRVAAGTLLDVGCGDGLFLSLARADGYGADGIEFSPEGARRASARIGRPVAIGDLARSPLHPGPFDIVTLWHVLEHLEAPGTMLDAVRRRLRPGGLLVVAVPNLDNRPMQIAYRLARGRALPLYEPGAREPHLSHFPPRPLEKLLAQHGLESAAIVPDRCALTLPKRLIDGAAALAGRLSGRILTDAMVAFARRTR